MGTHQRKETLDHHLDAWYAAAKLVEPVLADQGLKEYSVGSVFCATTRITKADQHIDLIIRVADWLLEDKEK